MLTIHVNVADIADDLEIAGIARELFPFAESHKCTKPDHTHAGG